MSKWLLIILIVLITACEDDQQDRQDPGACEPILEDPGTAMLSDPFEITGAEIIDDCLMITVRYSGGCKPHEFRLTCTLLPDFSSYSGILKLSHNANGDHCKALCTGNVYFDLTGLQESGLNLISLILTENAEDSDYQLLIKYYY